MFAAAILPLFVGVLVEPQPLAGTWQLSHVEQDGTGDPSCVASPVR
jgi:hypothetical protein